MLVPQCKGLLEKKEKYDETSASNSGSPTGYDSEIIDMSDFLTPEL